MKRVSKISLGIVVALILISALAFFSIRVLNVAAQSALLQNPGFEGEYISWGANEVRVAPSWKPWFAEGLTKLPGLDSNGAGSTSRPEYKPMFANEFAYRVKSGNEAQCYFSFSNLHYAGMYQVVSIPTRADTEGQWYIFSVWAQAYSNNKDQPLESPGELYMSLGIDPEGKEWYGSRAIVWTQWQWVQGAGSATAARWVKFESQPVYVTGNKLSVWISTVHKYALKHGDVYVDDADLRVVDMGQSTPQPCPTCVPSTGDCVTLPQLQAELNKLRFVVEE